MAKDPKELAKQDAAAASKSAPEPQQAELKQVSDYDAEVSSKGPRITTLEQLLDYCEVDREKWAVSDYRANKWEVGAKDSRGNITVTPLFQIKASLVRRAPVAVKPVRATKTPRVRVKGTKASQTAFFFPDTQHGFIWSEKYDMLTPYHDNRAIDVATQLCKKIQPDVIVMLGDHLDLAPWSEKFRTDPLMRQTTQPTIDTLYWHLRQIRLACPKAQIVFLAGNHEERLNKALDASVTEARHLRPANGKHKIAGLKHLLDLDSLDIETVEPYGSSWWLWKGIAGRPVHLNHGMSFDSAGSTAGKKAQKQVYSKVFGHIHRTEIASRTIHGPDGAYEVFSMSPGCLCRVDGAVPSVNPRMNWQQGVGVVRYDAEADQMYPELCSIQNGRLSYNGSVLVGVDRTDQIASDTGWPQMSP